MFKSHYAHLDDRPGDFRHPVILFAHPPKENLKHEKILVIEIRSLCAGNARLCCGSLPRLRVRAYAHVLIILWDAEFNGMYSLAQYLGKLKTQTGLQRGKTE